MWRKSFKPIKRLGAQRGTMVTTNRPTDRQTHYTRTLTVGIEFSMSFKYYVKAKQHFGNIISFLIWRLRFIFTFMLTTTERTIWFWGLGVGEKVSPVFLH